MKPNQMKLLKECFGSKKDFMKTSQCERCQLKRKCFLKVNNLGLGEVIYSKKTVTINKLT